MTTVGSSQFKRTRYVTVHKVLGRAAEMDSRPPDERSRTSASLIVTKWFRIYAASFEPAALERRFVATAGPHTAVTVHFNVELYVRDRLAIRARLRLVKCHAWSRCSSALLSWEPWICSRKPLRFAGPLAAEQNRSPTACRSCSDKTMQHYVPASAGCHAFLRLRQTSPPKRLATTCHVAPKQRRSVS